MRLLEREILIAGLDEGTPRPYIYSLCEHEGREMNQFYASIQTQYGLADTVKLAFVFAAAFDMFEAIEETVFQIRLSGYPTKDNFDKLVAALAKADPSSLSKGGQS